MKRMKYVSFIAIVLMAGLVNAGSTWYGLDSGDAWSEPSNWIGDGFPGPDTWVEIGVGFAQPCLLDSDASCKWLHVGVYDDAAASLTIKNGGNLTVNSGGDVSIGWNRNGTLNIETGGSLTANSLFTVGMYADVPGYARLNLQGGNLTVNNEFYHGIYFGGVAVDVRSQIDAGVLDVDVLHLDRGVMDITGGMVIVNGDMTGAVASWIAAGRLTAFNGAGSIVTEVSDGRTTITAVPEPATMVLLALGGLASLRRKNK